MRFWRARGPVEWRKAAIGAAVVAGVLATLAFAALSLSPWPSALVIRLLFDFGGSATNAAIAKYVPGNVVERLDVRYDRADRDSRLDVYFPAEVADTPKVLPVIVWVHGGGFVAGDKSQVANYGKVLAGHGYTTIAVNYSIAPRHVYPTPVRQVNAALAYIVRHAQELHVDASRIVLAGDSAGAHIAAQVANIVTNAQYAQAVGITPSIAPAQLAGAMLYCGAYDVGVTRYAGPLGWIGTTVLWSYSGSRTFAADRYFATSSVINHLTPSFPPAFISAGNGDSLLQESQAFATALAQQGVKVDALFFLNDHAPKLPHEYQFRLATEEGRLALDRSLAFLAAVTRR